ncbi:hypothetical protein IPC755_28670 [Pseudomonas aeruginosa]|uniref:hypothetical protein n=1 Tax=Pseudomonas aeruginosa TaxID=287 RepID=UPI000FC40AD4|nr:hypothetical protein [Pseudomonas aeruginosa]RUG38128.1 hypothetical protein IPC755_28670 [Pseudomonas aeruginosa]
MICEDYDYQADKEKHEKYIRDFNKVYARFLSLTEFIFGSANPTFEKCVDVLNNSDFKFSIDEDNREIVFYIVGDLSLKVEVCFDFSGKCHFSFPNAKEWTLKMMLMSVSDGNKILASSLFDVFKLIDRFEKGEKYEY